MLGRTGELPRELNRLDIKNRTPTPPLAEESIIKLPRTIHWNRGRRLIVLDQVSEADCGVVTGRVRDRLAELAAGDPGQIRPGRQPGAHPPVPQRVREAEPA